MDSNEKKILDFRYCKWRRRRMHNFYDRQKLSPVLDNAEEAHNAICLVFICSRYTDQGELLDDWQFDIDLNVQDDLK